MRRGLAVALIAVGVAVALAFVWRNVPEPVATPSPSPSASVSTTATTTPSATTPPVDRHCETSRILVPTCGAWWGSAQVPGSVSDLQGLETVIGTNLPVAHVFHRAGQAFPDSQEQQLATRLNPSVLFGNVKPGFASDAPSLTWRQVADGEADEFLDAIAAAITDLNQPVFLAIQHEPEDDVDPLDGSGYTTTDFVDMYRHVVTHIDARIAESSSADTGFPIWVWDVTGYPKWEAMWPQLYPGDSYVDWVAYDPYLQDPSGCDFSCVANRTYAGYPDWTGFYDWAEVNLPNKPLMLGEWGVRESQVAGSETAKASLFATVPGLLASDYPRLLALIYFNDNKSPDDARSSRIETSDDSLQAFREMVTDPYFMQNRARVN